MQSLTGRPWETIPLNDSPFLTALVLARLPNVCFTKGLAMFFSESDVLPSAQRCVAVLPTLFLEPGMGGIFRVFLASVFAELFYR